jgi:GGDEF domain-containing protein/HAMP domain-containing protein
VTVTVLPLTAEDYARMLNGQHVEVLVRNGTQTLVATLPAATDRQFTGDTAKLDGVSYRVVTQPLAGLPGQRLQLTILSALGATNGSLGSSRLLAAGFIAAFLVLALSFSLIASRALEGQLSRFLEAARRLAGGDFSSPVPVEGNDDFAALGVEFNRMSNQLEHRLDELEQERGRLRESIRRIGETFASNLDRPALLEVALRASVDAVQADCGRLTVRDRPGEPLGEVSRFGSLIGIEDQFIEAERAALRNRIYGEGTGQGVNVAAVVLGPLEAGRRAQGLVTVGRRDRPFTNEDRQVLRSLAAQATAALENVELHYQVARQAVTDKLTSLANHGRFQEILTTEMDQVRRYNHPVGLIMLDIDNFKTVNDTYGHPQGDVVLKHVARVLRENSRETDAPARYGGEEMALILPHTDLEGSYAIAAHSRGDRGARSAASRS